jgi:predicted nucleic-acid-binding protein
MTVSSDPLVGGLHQPERAYVDANVIIRHLTRDAPDMADQALALFASAERREIRLIVTIVTLAEVVWTLASFYKLERHDIAERLLLFVTADGIELQSQDEATLALSMYHDRNVNFEDALLAARSLLVGPPVVYSFDCHFDRIPGIQRRIPGQPTHQEE